MRAVCREIEGELEGDEELLGVRPSGAAAMLPRLVCRFSSLECAAQLAAKS